GRACERPRQASRLPRPSEVARMSAGSAGDDAVPDTVALPHATRLVVQYTAGLLDCRIPRVHDRSDIVGFDAVDQRCRGLPYRGLSGRVVWVIAADLHSSRCSLVQRTGPPGVRLPTRA